MLDIGLIRTDPDGVAALLARRMGAEEAAAAVAAVAELDREARSLLAQLEALRAERKQAARARVETVSRQTVGVFQGALQAVVDKLQPQMAALPNLPADDVPAGGKESNIEIARYGERPPVPARDHATVARDLGLVDHARGATLAGSGFWIYTGVGARLEWALLDWFIAESEKAGYQFTLPPLILHERAGYGAGQFPKFRSDVFSLPDGRFLPPTAETALVNMYAGEILPESALPVKLSAYTPCFRRESGSRSHEAGTVRGHQFNKVELVQFTSPGQAKDAAAEMLAHAESLVQRLGLHYRTVLLAAGDASASMRRTVDVEVWLPSINRFVEVSSVSWAGDYQARRAGTRYRPIGERRTRYVHTLNGSALATSRLVPALLEHYLQADGSVLIPEVLRPRMGVDRLIAEGAFEDEEFPP